MGSQVATKPVGAHIAGRSLEEFVTKCRRQIRPVYVSLLAACIFSGLFAFQYYRPVLNVPVSGKIREFQVYSFAPGSGYTERNALFYFSRVALSAGGIELRDLRFPATSRFRLHFLGTGRVRIAGAITRTDNTLLESRFTRYLFDPTKVIIHGMTVTGPDLLFREADQPYVEIPLDSLPVLSIERTFTLTPLLVVAFLFGSALFLWRFHNCISGNAATVLAMVGICTLLGMVALTLRYNHGPDEELHCLSGEWYLNHDRPPSMDDPIYYNSYFGVNYLIGSPDLTYWLTFHAVSAFDRMTDLEVFREARLAELGFIFAGLLVLLAFADRPFAWSYLLCILAVPQVAYTATYVNGDVLSFFFGFIALALLLSRRELPGMAIFAVLFVLPGLKLNYYVLIPVALYFVYRRYNRRGLIWALGGLLVGSYKLIFTWIDALILGRSTLANQIMHISNPVFKERLLHPYMQWSVLTNAQFYEWSSKSLYAFFGYMNYQFAWYYYAAGVVLLCAILVRNELFDNLLIAIVALANLAASLYFSISYAYQPQGRYLFPAVITLFVISAKHIMSRAYAVFAIPTVLAILTFWWTAAGT